MKIGLIRHFKVDYSPWKKICTAKEFSEAMINYENSPIIPGEIYLNGTEWEVCYCSTISRAIETAKIIFKGKIILSSKIVEVPVEPFTQKKIKLPSFVWHLGGRIAWHKNHHSQPETRKETVARIKIFLEELSNKDEKNILIVTHGFFMRVFIEELQKIGFRGKIDIRPENGKLYLFEKKVN